MVCTYLHGEDPTIVTEFFTGYKYSGRLLML